MLNVSELSRSNISGRGTWILCANLWGARVFRCGGLDQGPGEIEFLRELERPGIRTALEDFPEPGDDLAAVPEDLRAERLAAMRFMRYVSIELERECGATRFDHIIVCAEPELMRILREDLLPCTKAKLCGEVGLDLYEVNESDLMNYVKDFIPDLGSAA
jgi:hypothetical protein